MKGRLLGHDSFYGLSTYHHYDEQTGQTHIEYVQDVQPILEQNKALANTDMQKQGIKNGWMFYGSIPNVVIHRWLKEGIDFYNKDHWPAVKRKLRSSEYKYLNAGNAKL